jgi:hypothetical protein
VLQSLGLKMDRIGEGWEVHAMGERGIIFPTFQDAVEAIAQLSGISPGAVMVRRDGSVLVERGQPKDEASG